MSEAAHTSVPSADGYAPRLVKLRANGEEAESSTNDETVPKPLRWWRELLLAGIFYAVYSFIRNTQGSALVSRAVAEANAFKIIDIEKFFGLYHERGLQQLFIRMRPSMEIWNFFYGTFHFIVTAAVLIFLFRRFPDRYRLWRNTLAGTTALALIGFATYPLLPPRLLPNAYGFIDSLKVYGGPWSFDSGSMQVISNQYAAMPSLHFAWALWSGLAVLPVLRRRWTKALAVLYPVLTLFAIVVTANHFILDAAGGAAVVGVGWLLARGLYLRRLRSPSEPASSEPASTEPAPSDREPSVAPSV